MQDTTKICELECLLPHLNLWTMVCVIPLLRKCPVTTTKIRFTRWKIRQGILTMLTLHLHPVYWNPALLDTCLLGRDVNYLFLRDFSNTVYFDVASAVKRMRMTIWRNEWTIFIGGWDAQTSIGTRPLHTL